MVTIRRIIAVTDFSVPADRAMRRAALIAKAAGAELHLLHVVHPLDLYPGMDLGLGDLAPHNQAIAAGALNRLEAMAAKLHKLFGIEIRSATRIGRAHTEIADYAHRLDADLIVAGARGENNLLDLLLGSTAMRVLRVATCPVLIVKLQLQPTPYRIVLVAMDLSLASVAAPALGRAVAPEARMELLHVYDEDIEVRMREAKLDAAFVANYRAQALAESESQLDSLLAEQAGPVTRQVVTGYPAAAICEHINQLHAELVVLGRSGKSGKQEWLLGSVAKDVANAAVCDVLFLRNRPED